MRKKREERRRLRRLKIRTIFMLSFTLIFNAYAWFLYITTVSTNMTVHVEAWSVNFSVDNEAVERELLFDVEHAYPGMDEVKKTIAITNSGEKSADVNYKIASITILDKQYVVEEELTSEEKDMLTGQETKLTQEEMVRMLANDFPFKLIVTSTKDQLDIGQNASVSISFSWEFEGGDDSLDTKYGVDSYKYYQENNGEAPIKAKIKINVQQHKDATTN